MPASRISSSPPARRQLHAGRVAAVAVHLRARRRDRATRPPDLEPHSRCRRSRSSGQNRIIAPEEPCSEATIGNALASIFRLSPPGDHDREGRVRRAAPADRLGRLQRVDLDRRAVHVERAERLGPLVGFHPARPPRTSARAAPRRPRCRRRRPRPSRAGTQASRCWSAGCERGSARAASAVAASTSRGAILPPIASIAMQNVQAQRVVGVDMKSVFARGEESRLAAELAQARARIAELEAERDRVSPRDPDLPRAPHPAPPFASSSRPRCSRAERYARSLAVAVIDVDGFREFNLQHGYRAGDRLLGGGRRPRSPTAPARTISPAGSAATSSP